MPGRIKHKDKLLNRKSAEDAKNIINFSAFPTFQRFCEVAKVAGCLNI